MLSLNRLVRSMIAVGVVAALRGHLGREATALQARQLVPEVEEEQTAVSALVVAFLFQAATMVVLGLNGIHNTVVAVAALVLTFLVSAKVPSAEVAGTVVAVAAVQHLQVRLLVVLVAMV
jgi:hypothetical protein